MAEELETKPPMKKTIPVQEGIFTMPDSPDGLHLVGSKCKFCGTVAFPKRKRCLKCFRDEVNSVLLSQRGKVSTWSIIRMKPHGYRGTVPYVLAEVEMPENLRLRAHLTGVNLEHPEIRIGDDVEIVSEKIYEDENGNDVICYKFKPVLFAK